MGLSIFLFSLLNSQPTKAGCFHHRKCSVEEFVNTRYSLDTEDESRRWISIGISKINNL